MIDGIARSLAYALLNDLNKQGYVLVTETNESVSPEEAEQAIVDALAVVLGNEDEE